MTKAIYLVQQEIDLEKGISKKIDAQLNALIYNGLDVSLMKYKRFADDQLYVVNKENKVANIGKGLKFRWNYYFGWTKMTKFFEKSGIEFLYIRYAHTGSYNMIRFLKALKKIGVTIFLEIPTYPYDNEYKNVPLAKRLQIWSERIWRKQFYKYISRIVTFSAEKMIFGISCVNIANGIDWDNIKMSHSQKKTGQITITGVANYVYWHAYDRLIEGLFHYYKKNGDKIQLYFNIVGNGDLGGLKKMVQEYGLENNVFFLGPKNGEELDKIFDVTDIGLGCLGCHRKNITQLRSLKNVEYASRGIPFIFSESSIDFDGKSYVYKPIADESPVNIEEVIKWFGNLNVSHKKIRDDAQFLSWNTQMKTVVNNISINK